MTLREIILARAEQVHGGSDGARSALARRMAPIWGISPESAVHDLSRYLRGGEIRSGRVETLLSELGLLEPMARFATGKVMDLRTTHGHEKIH